MLYEKLGAFYLGREYDIGADQLLERPLMYDARDLTTHAACVGMTGSGKTGLCVDLLEEAAIDHVPAIIIDPKGDITNLLLTFPDLLPEDFRPWINVDDARRKGLSEEEFSAQQAELWRQGLADWGRDGDRIRLLKESAEFTIYTPGSDAGIPVSILQSFAAPGGDWDNEAELLRERIQGTVSAILGLIGVDADQVRSREYILLANLFEHYWRQGEDLDLPKLILSIQKPPLRRLGVFDVETFFLEIASTGLAPSQPELIAPAAPAVLDSAASPLPTTPPVAPSRVDQVFLPLRRSAVAAQAEFEARMGRPLVVQRADLVYEPAVLGMGRVHFVDQRREVDEREDFALLVRPPDGSGVLRWDRAQALDMVPRDLAEHPQTDAYFDDLPVAIDESTEFTALKTNLDDHLYRTSSLTLLHSPSLKMYSHARETDRDFRMRLQHAVREARDEEVDAVTTQYEKRLRKLEDRLRRAQAAVAKKEADAEARKREVLVSVGESVLGVFFGRRSTRTASSALSKYRQSGSAELEVQEAKEDVAAVGRDIDELEAELRHEADAIRARWDEALETLEEFPVTPRRSDIDIDVFALAWAPHWHLSYEDGDGRYRTEVIQAY